MIEKNEMIFNQHGNPEYDQNGNIILISSEMLSLAAKYFAISLSNCLTAM